MWIMYYFIIGAAYVFVNVFVRKLHKNIVYGGELIGLAWLLAWPMFFVLLFLEKLIIPAFNRLKSLC